MDLEEKIIQKKVVYQGKYLRTEEHLVRLPDGREAKREIVVPPNAVGILALGSNESTYLVRQYRTAIQKITLEIPAGIIDPGEEALETARRECEEEIGMTPGKLSYLFSFYHSVGFSTGKIQVFLAEDLRPCEHVDRDSDEFLEIHVLPIKEVYEKVSDGEIVDSKTLMAFLWYRQLNQSQKENFGMETEEKT